jgi:hypothetical protein
MSECLKKLYPNMVLETVGEEIRAICEIDDRRCMNPSKSEDEWQSNPVGKSLILLSGCLTAFTNNCSRCERNGN